MFNCKERARVATCDQCAVEDCSTGDGLDIYGDACFSISSNDVPEYQDTEDDFYEEVDSPE